MRKNMDAALGKSVNRGMNRFLGATIKFFY
jgi:hypothetical protein